MTMLEVSDLYAGYDNGSILNGVSFRLESGSMTGILGMNGCGKSTLMKVICGIMPGSGEIKLMERDVRKLSARELSRISRYIPQRSGISMDISVLDVVLMGFNPGLGLLEYPNAAMRHSAMDALSSVGLEDRAQSNFQSLSEGQKQLCMLARAMLLEKGVLFLDEPESALDFSARYQMLELIRKWAQKSQNAALIALHDPQLAMNTCDTLLLFRDGKCEKRIRPQQDDLAETEKALTETFGSLSIHFCSDRRGKAQFVLLKEE